MPKSQTIRNQYIIETSYSQSVKKLDTSMSIFLTLQTCVLCTILVPLKNILSLQQTALEVISAREFRTHQGNILI